MRRGKWRAAAVLCAPAWIAAGVLAGCSLLTDLGGLTGGDTAASPDAPSSETASSEAEASVDAGADVSDARPVVTGPYVPRYERSLAIMNGASSPLAAGYTACFRALPSDILGPGAATKLRSDAADFRVFASGVELKRVVDIFRTGILSICFRLASAVAPGATDTSYAVRYGDPAAVPPAPAESDVFDFFDGFDGASLDARWMKTGAPVVAGGFVTLPKGAPAGITTTASTDGVPLDTSLEINARVPAPSSDGELQDDAGEHYFYWFGFQHLGDFSASPPWSLFIARSKSTVNAEHHPSTGAGPCSSGCDEAAGTQTTDARVYKVDRVGDNALFTYDTGSTFSASAAVGDLSIMIRNYLVSSDVVVDWVRARPLVFPEPVPTIGPEVTLSH